MHSERKKLFSELDKAFASHGYAAGFSNPGFHPHYAETIGGDIRPTWYKLYEFDNCKLYTMYESSLDLCLSTLFEVGKAPLSAIHSGYPTDIESAKIYADYIRKQFCQDPSK